MVCVYIFLIKEGEAGGKMIQRRLPRGERERRAKRVKMVICPGPTAIKPGGRNWFLDDRGQASQGKSSPFLSKRSE